MQTCKASWSGHTCVLVCRDAELLLYALCSYISFSFGYFNPLNWLHDPLTVYTQQFLTFLPWPLTLNILVALVTGTELAPFYTVMIYPLFSWDSGTPELPPANNSLASKASALI